MTGREGENKVVHFRTDRIECINGAWYFCVREQMAPLGPYSTKADAELAIRVFIRDLENGVSSSQAFSNQKLADRFSLL